MLPDVGQELLLPSETPPLLQIMDIFYAVNELHSLDLDELKRAAGRGKVKGSDRPAFALARGLHRPPHRVRRDVPAGPRLRQLSIEHKKQPARGVMASAHPDLPGLALRLLQIGRMCICISQHLSRRGVLPNVALAVANLSGMNRTNIAEPTLP